MTYGGDVEPGRYVFVDVVDNGHGMTDETQARMFDPFFSTRDRAAGSAWRRCAARPQPPGGPARDHGARAGHASACGCR